MSTAQRPEDLVVWQLSSELKQGVYAFTETGPASRDFEFRNDIREAARSALDNISEGFYRYVPREFNRFLNIARGSLGEVRNQLIHAHDARCVEDAQFKELFHLANRAIGALTKLQEYLRACPEFVDRRPMGKQKGRSPKLNSEPRFQNQKPEPRTKNRNSEPRTMNPEPLRHFAAAKYPSLVRTARRGDPGRATLTLTFRQRPSRFALVDT